MKIFIRKIVLMSFITIGVLLLSTFINYVLLKYDNTFKMTEKVNTLILGDSHTRYALNDSILNNTFNLSNDADSYFYSYLKLKQVEKKNEQLDTVLLSFSQHNIHKCIENRWLLNDQHLKGRLEQYIPLLSFDDYLFLLKNKPFVAIASIFSQIKYPPYLFMGKNKYGGYKDLKRVILEEEIDKQKTNGYRQEYKSFNDSPLETMYLKKIVQFCETNDLTLIFINPPLYKTLQNKQFGLYKYYEMNFSNITFLDFSKLEMKDSYFGDLVHLTPSGARYFSELIKNEKLFNLENARTHNILYK
jgi:hypothetical protein